MKDKSTKTESTAQSDTVLIKNEAAYEAQANGATAEDQDGTAAPQVFDVYPNWPVPAKGISICSVEFYLHF